MHNLQIVIRRSKSDQFQTAAVAWPAVLPSIRISAGPALVTSCPCPSCSETNTTKALFACGTPITLRRIPSDHFELKRSGTTGPRDFDGMLTRGQVIQHDLAVYQIARWPSSKVTVPAARSV